MKPFFVVMLLSLLVLSPAARAVDGPEDDYAAIYGLILQGDAMSDKGDLKSAHAKYAEAQTALKKLRFDNPDWNVKAVKYRLNYLASRLEQTAVKNPPPTATNSTTNAANQSSPASADSAQAGEPVEMKVKWNVGKRYVQRMESTQATEMTLPGSPQPMKQETKQTQDVSLSVLKERDGGGRELEMEILGMALVSRAGGRDLLSFDSKKDASDDAGNPAAPMLRKLVGARIKFLTDAGGEIESVEGLKEIFDRVTEGHSAMEQEMIKGMFSEDNFKEMYSAAQGLPDKPVKIGDTWPLKLEVSMGPLGTVILNSQYTFKGWEQHNNHKCAVLQFTGTLSAASDPGSASGMTIDNGKTSGKTWFDPALGMVIDTTAKQGMTIKVNTQGQSLTTKVNASVSNKLVEVADTK